jgi:predicted enzyme related to lactoylglutathione lyase
LPSSICPVIVTPDIDRLLTFYSGLLGTEEVMRFPPHGPLFYIVLRAGDSEMGLAANAEVTLDAPGRMLLSLEVADVDALLPRVEELGGRAKGPPTDMPWGQRVAHVADPDGNSVNLTQTL